MPETDSDSFILARFEIAVVAVCYRPNVAGTVRRFAWYGTTVWVWYDGCLVRSWYGTTVWVHCIGTMQ